MQDTRSKNALSMEAQQKDGKKLEKNFAKHWIEMKKPVASVLLPSNTTLSYPC